MRTPSRLCPLEHKRSYLGQRWPGHLGDTGDVVLQNKSVNASERKRQIDLLFIRQCPLDVETGFEVVQDLSCSVVLVNESFEQISNTECMSLSRETKEEVTLIQIKTGL